MTFWRKIAASLLYYIVTAYCLSWRVKFKNREIFNELIQKGKRPVIAIWHDQLLACSFTHRKDALVTIASDSKDGELITFALSKWNFKVARGSSTRGGVKAALGAIKLSQKLGIPCAVTVDGPKGPRHIVKNGAVFIAQNLDCIIVVGIAHAKKFIRFNSWDKFVLPLPFSTVEITYSEPLYVDAGQDKLEEGRIALQKIMTELTNEASPLSI